MKRIKTIISFALAMAMVVGTGITTFAAQPMLGMTYKVA